MAYTFTNLIDDVLRTVKEPLSEKEIWEEAVKLGLDIKVGTAGKTLGNLSELDFMIF